MLLFTLAALLLSPQLDASRALASEASSAHSYLETRIGASEIEGRDLVGALGSLSAEERSGYAVSSGGGAAGEHLALLVHNANCGNRLPAGHEPYQLELFPREPYDRVKHYGNTPTAAQKRAVPKGMEFDHDPMLVQHYYEGPGGGGLPGFNLTPAERKAYAASLSSGKPSAPKPQRRQGGDASVYSKQMKRLFALGGGKRKVP